MPSEVPGPTADVARDTLGAAIEVAATLPGTVGAALVLAAQSSFIDAIRIVAAVTAVIAIAGAAAAAAGLRSVPKRAEAPAAAPEAAAG